MAPQALQQLWWHHFHRRHSNVQRWMQHVKSCLRRKREKSTTGPLWLASEMAWYHGIWETWSIYIRLQVFCLFVTFFCLLAFMRKNTYLLTEMKYHHLWHHLCVLTLDCGCKIFCQKLWLVTSSRGSCMIYVLCFFYGKQSSWSLMCMFLVGLMDISGNWWGVNVEILT